MHRKGNEYTVKSLSEAHDLVEFCSKILHENEKEIRSSEKISGVLNGPQGLGLGYLPKRLVLLISRRIALNAWQISLASTITARAIF